MSAFAAALLWIAYLVPHRLRHRQQLLESRAEDRFSGALRVLAVTDRQGRALRAGEARADCGPDIEKRSGLLTPARGIPARGHGVVAVRGGGIVDRPHGTQDKMSADAARRVAQRRALRAASLARRAAAARRRAVLTVALLTVSAAAWVVVGVTAVAVVAAVAPTVALAGVLVLGRRAVIHGHAADAAWERQARTAGGAHRAGAMGDPMEPVTGRAYHPSDARTEVISRIRVETPAGGQAWSAGARARETGAEAGAAAAGTATAANQLTEASAQVHGAGSNGAESHQLQAWSPVPVPRPMYTTKAAAPRREPIPLVLDEPGGAATDAATSSDETHDASEGAPAELEAAGSTPNPTLDLDAILARRRSAG